MHPALVERNADNCYVMMHTRVGLQEHCSCRDNDELDSKPDKSYVLKDAAETVISSCALTFRRIPPRQATDEHWMEVGP